MKIDALNIFRFIKRLLFIVCVFVCPLVFTTDLTRNPYNIQSFILTCATSMLVLMWGAKAMVLRQANIKFCTADIIFFLFVAACALSLGLNIAFSDQPSALWNEALRRGNILITNTLMAYMAAKSIKAYDPAEDKNNYFFSALILLWGFCWLLYPSFKMAGLFDIYAILMWCAGFYLCLKCLKRFSIKAFCDIFIAVAALASVYGIMQNLGMEIFWNINISYEFGSRAISTFGNPNFLSSYIVLFLPLAAVYYLAAKKPGERFFYFCVIMLFSAYLVISMTRSSWLGAAAGFILLLFFKAFRTLLAENKKRAFFSLLCAGLIFFLWPLQPRGDYSSAAASRIKEVSNISSFSNFTLSAPEERLNQAYHQRLMMWTCGLEMFKDSPVIGKGWGSFQLEYAPCQGRLIFLHPDLQWLKTQANAAHNEFVEVLSQSGLIGLLIYIAFFISAIWTFLRAYKKITPGARLFYCALFAGAAAMLADNMLNITMQTAILAFTFWLVVSALVSAGVERKTKKMSLITGIFLFIFCFVMSLSLFKWQRNNFMSDIYDFKAAREFALERYNSSISNMRKSLRYSHNKAESFYLLVNAFIKTNNFENAKEVVGAALQYFPHYYEFYFRRASVNSAQGDNPKAVEDLKQVLRLFPSYKPAAVVFAAMVADDKKLQTEENMKFLTALTTLMPYNQDINLALAEIYTATGRYAAAREILLRVTKRDNFNTGLIAALEAANKAMGIKNDDVLAKANELSALKRKLGQEPLPEGIQEKLESVLARYPGDLSAIMLMGEFYYKTGKYKQAIDLLDPVYKIYNDDAALNFALASCYSSSGDKDAAAQYLNSVLARDPFNITASERLEKLKKVL